jgi:hypothetical protein
MIRNSASAASGATGSMPMTDGIDSYRLAQATAGHRGDAPQVACAGRRSPLRLAYRLGSATTDALTPSGENRWPAAGRKHVRRWGGSMAPLWRNRWPSTALTESDAKLPLLGEERTSQTTFGRRPPRTTCERRGRRPSDARYVGKQAYRRCRRPPLGGQRGRDGVRSRVSQAAANCGVPYVRQIVICRMLGTPCSQTAG